MAFGTMLDSAYGSLWHRGFNPCFSGMAFGTTGADYMTMDEMKFQSLFFWNGLWDVWPRPKVPWPPMSFNPCFSGMAFGT